MAGMMKVHWQGDYTDIRGNGRYGHLDTEITEEMWYRIQNDPVATERLIKQHIYDCEKVACPYLSLGR
ncbi:MAG: hypothetical protein MJZ93_04405 [Paludibacteraceae bacterium]|nr:hypothetical protein [Paludibacteraceae bacterium]